MISQKSPTFSIIIPVFNEEENIAELSRRLASVMDSIDTHEIIFVDDGSTDKSWQIIRELHEKDQRIKGVSFSRNFGHHIAITAGLDHAEGMTIILMDGDLQDPPEEIPKLLNKLKEGYELVYGIRKQKKDSMLKRITSYIFWWLINSLSGLNIPRNQTLLRIFDRQVLDVLNGMRERARFIHGMIAWTGFKTAVQEVEHAPRMHGMTKYNIIKLFSLAFNAITSFSTFPLRLATYLGLLSACVGLFFGSFFIYKKIFLGIPILGYASIIVAVLFVGGVQLLILGIIGEYIGRVYQEVQARPIYIVREKLI